MFTSSYDTSGGKFKPFYGFLISRGDAKYDPNYGYWHIGFHWGNKIFKVHFQKRP